MELHNLTTSDKNNYRQFCGNLFSSSLFHIFCIRWSFLLSQHSWENLLRTCKCLGIWLCFTNTDTATITVLATETTQFGMSTPESPTLGTDVSFTGIDFNTSPSSTLENKVLPSDENSNISQSTTLNIEVSSNEKNNINQSTTTRTGVSSTNQNFNISQITVSTTFPSEADLNIQSSKHLITYTW